MNRAPISALRQEIGRRLRVARGTTPRNQVADRLGVHENTIGKLERGETVPDAEHLVHLAAMFDRSVAWMVGQVPESAAEGTEAESKPDAPVNEFVHLGGAVVTYDAEIATQLANLIHRMHAMCKLPARLAEYASQGTSGPEPMVPIGAVTSTLSQLDAMLQEAADLARQIESDAVRPMAA